MFPAVGPFSPCSGTPRAPLVVEPWTVRVDDLILNSMGPSSRSSYLSKVREFEMFCHQRGLLAGWPPPVKTILCFMLHLHDAGLAPRSIAVYLAALKFITRFLGKQDTIGDFRIRKMMEGMRRARLVVPGRWRPITLKMLRGLCIIIWGFSGV